MIYLHFVRHTALLKNGSFFKRVKLVSYHFIDIGYFINLSMTEKSNFISKYGVSILVLMNKKETLLIPYSSNSIFKETHNNRWIMEKTEFWKKCSSCKTEIGFSQKYYVCSVSTCNGKRTGYKFCSVNCFETHLPGARHKDAAAIEETAPKKSQTSTENKSGQRRIVRPGQLSKPSNRQIAHSTDEVLIIASRLKEFINQQSEFSTSASVMDALSHHIRHVAMQAIDNARADGRKTVMDKDLRFLEKLNLNIN